MNASMATGCAVPTLPVKEEGLTWEEITSEPHQRHVVMERHDLDCDGNEGTIHQWSLSLEVQVNSLPRKETLMETLMEPQAEAPHDDVLVEAAMGL